MGKNIHLSKVSLVAAGLIVTIIFVCTSYIPFVIESHENILLPSSRKTGVCNNFQVSIKQESVSMEIRKPQTLFYSRIMKTGSNTFLSIVKPLINANKRCAMIKLPMDVPEADVAGNYSSTKAELVFGPEDHVPFVNFTRFGVEMPEYFSFIRDPLDHVVSAYYHQTKFFEGYMNTSLDMCLEQAKPLCSEGSFSQGDAFNVFKYFCGYGNDCHRKSLVSLNKAIQNVDRYYGVVGIVEDYMETLKVLELAYPDYFTGLYKAGKGKRKQNVRQSKPETTERSLQYLHLHLSLDYEFYFFIKRRFYEHLYSIKKHVSGFGGSSF